MDLSLKMLMAFSEEHKAVEVVAEEEVAAARVVEGPVLVYDETLRVTYPCWVDNCKELSSTLDWQTLATKVNLSYQP